MPVAAAGTEPDQLLALATAAAGARGRRLRRGRARPASGSASSSAAAATSRRRRRGSTSGCAPPTSWSRPCASWCPTSATTSSTPGPRRSSSRPLGPSHPEASIGLVPNLAASRSPTGSTSAAPPTRVDAACAQLAVAVDQAVTELAAGPLRRGARRRRAPLPRRHALERLLPARALSPSGRIRPFDRGADGILIGEGTGIVVLKRLADAERDGDRVYAVIRGTGVVERRPRRQPDEPRRRGPGAGPRAGLGRPPGSTRRTRRADRGARHATPAGDSAELATLRRVFGRRRRRASAPGRARLGEVDDRPRHARRGHRRADQGGARRAPRGRCRRPCTATSRTPTWRRSRLRGRHRGRSRGRRRRARAGPASTPSGSAASTPTSSSRSARGAGRAAAPAGEHAAARGVAAADPRARRRLRRGRRERPTVTRLFVAAATTRRRWPRGWPTATRCWPAPSWPALGERGRRGSPSPTRPRSGSTLARKVVAPGPAVARPQRRLVRARGLLAGGGRVAFAFPGIEPAFDARVDDVAAHFGLDRRAGARRRVRPRARRAPAIMYVGRLLDRGAGRLGVRARRGRRPQPRRVDGDARGRGGRPRGDRPRSSHGIAAGDLEVPDLVFVALGCGVPTWPRRRSPACPTSRSRTTTARTRSILCGVRGVGGGWPSERLTPSGCWARCCRSAPGFHSPMFADVPRPVRATPSARCRCSRPPCRCARRRRTARSPTTTDAIARPRPPPLRRAGAVPRAGRSACYADGRAGVRAAGRRAASPASSATRCTTATTWRWPAPRPKRIGPGPARPGGRRAVRRGRGRAPRPRWRLPAPRHRARSGADGPPAGAAPAPCCGSTRRWCGAGSAPLERPAPRPAAAPAPPACGRRRPAGRRVPGHAAGRRRGRARGHRRRWPRARSPRAGGAAPAAVAPPPATATARRRAAAPAAPRRPMPRAPPRAAAAVAGRGARADRPRFYRQPRGPGTVATGSRSCR